MFEAIALAVLITFGSLFLGFSITEIGGVAIVGSIVATVWNYTYNLGFDLSLKRMNGTTQKSLRARVIHAIGFEISMLILLLPFIMWWLDLSAYHALALDITFAVFFVFYTFVFTWIYDRVFPAPA